MLKNRIVKFIAAFSIVIVLGLVLTPHYSKTCGCGDLVEKKDGNKLTYIIREAARFVHDKIIFRR